MIKTIFCWSALATLISGCATPAQPLPAEDWRRESIVQISAPSSMPSYVDRHCLDLLESSAGQDREALMLYFRVGRARYYQAFPSHPDAGWKVGDKVVFDSATCQVRRSGRVSK